jgi:hypothetical protein
MITEQIAQVFRAKKTATGWQARCPAHDDKNASLSITQGDDGKTLLHCHAGCSFNDIAAAANLKPGDLFPDEPSARRSRVVAEYSYQDATGRELFQVVRFEPKDFRQRRSNGGKWVWNLKGIDRVLYRLPQVIEAKDKRIIFVVEGEKDVAALESLGLVATCNAGGAGKWEPQYTESLKGAMVVMIPDGDPAGRKHRDLVCTELIGVAKWVKSVELPAKDASLWIQQGGTKADLAVMVKNARVYNPADYPEEPDATGSLGDMRSVTSAENGSKGGRPKAPSHADTAEVYAKSELQRDGVYVVRHWRGKWYAYEDGSGWREMADIDVQGRLITYLRGDPELRNHATAHYASSVMLNMRAHDLCGLPETVTRPCWLDNGEDGRN